MRIGRPGLVSAIAFALAASPLGAQPAARVLIAGGAATDLRGVRSGAYTVAPSLTLARYPDLVLLLGGRATRFTNRAWSAGGSAGATLRVPFAWGVGLVLDGSGEATRTSYRGTYLSAEGTPALEWRAARLALWAGVRGATARTSFDNPLAAGAAGLPGSSGVTRSLVGLAFGGSLLLAGQGGRGGIELSYREEHGGPGGVRLADRAAAVSLSHGVLSTGGTLGWRQAADEARTFGAIRLLVRLTPGIALSAAAESYPSNRLTGATGGRALTAGLSLGIGGPRPPRALPRPAGIPAPRPGFTRLALAAPNASTVAVAGDWNGWTPVPLRRSRNGVWYADLAIPPGGYRYGFRVDGKEWQVPKEVAAVDDGFGGKSAWLTVSGPERTATQSANRKEVP